MEIAFYNGEFIPKNEIRISPDDRGFLFADGIYEVVKWYGGSFFDIETHLFRLKRSLREIRLEWPDNESFPDIATQLVIKNGLSGKHAMIYLQVTRGAARRIHHFPDNDVPPTVYAFAKELPDTGKNPVTGIGVIMKEDIRWKRCDIKSVSLLPNVMGNQEAREQGCKECVFIRNGFITEASHSNVFFVINGQVQTHPESDFILSGVTRKNVIRIASDMGITVKEEPLHESELENTDEVFITNTTGEVTPVITINGKQAGDGVPGKITSLLREKLLAEISATL
jgi:D-alanine transaminase